MSKSVLFIYASAKPISALAMGDKSERRRQREAAIREFNAVAEAVGLEAINVRAGFEDIDDLYRRLCALDISGHLDEVRNARLKFVENGGGDLPEALLDESSGNLAETRA